MSTTRIACLHAAISVAAFAFCSFDSARAAEVYADKPSATAAEDAPTLHTALVGDLRARFGLSEGIAWEPTTALLPASPDEWLLQTPEKLVWGQAAANVPRAIECAAGDAGCDADFGLKRCTAQADCGDNSLCRPVLASVRKPGDAPVSMCVGASEFFGDRAYSVIVKAEHTVDIVSLSPPTGRFETAIRNALLFLGTKPVPPTVRMLYASSQPTVVSGVIDPALVLNPLIDRIRATDPDFAVHVSLGWLYTRNLSWNHAKIVVADSSDAIVGGENFWNDDYLGVHPVFDLSVRLGGGIAAAAQRFADTLWASRFIQSVSFPTGTTPESRHAQTPTQPGTIPAIAVGRLGVLGDNASDAALIGLVAHAKHNVRISQQDFYMMVPTLLSQSFALNTISDAVLRGVEVYIVQSNFDPTRNYGMVSPESTFRALVRAAELRARITGFRDPEGRTAHQVVCANLHYAPFRFSADRTWPDGHQLGTHSKFVMADDAAFYIGSHNLYPANLQEFGVIVFDADAARRVYDDFWRPEWQASSAAALPCPGGG